MHIKHHGGGGLPTQKRLVAVFLHESGNGKWNMALSIRD